MIQFAANDASVTMETICSVSEGCVSDPFVFKAVRCYLTKLGQGKGASQCPVPAAGGHCRPRVNCLPAAKRSSNSNHGDICHQ